jgi:Glycosyltransferases involved in cell wall biogenesis
MKLSVIIPCYNEAKTIKEIIEKVKNEKNYEKEIIVIDDSSNDGTIEILKDEISNQINKLLLNEKNYGKGYCVRKGVEAATGDIIIIQRC